MSNRTLIAIVAAVLAVGAAAAGILLLTEVTDRGKDLRPYESGPVYKIEIGGEITAYADAESKPDPDVISGSILVALATACLFTLMVLRLAGGEPRLRLFYGAAAIGFAFLAFDEFCALHETIGHNLPFLADLPGVERPDDVVFSAFLLPGVIFFVYFRDVLLATPRLRWLFGAALGAALLSGVADIADIIIEEPMEILSAALLIAGIATLISTHLPAYVRIAPPAQTD